MKLPDHDNWHMSFRNMADIVKGTEILGKAMAPLRVAGIEIQADCYLPEHLIVLTLRGEYAGMIILEYPYDAAKRLVESFDGIDPVVWS